MKGNTCKLHDCDKPSGGKSKYCSMHQARIARHGGPYMVMHRYPLLPKEIKEKRAKREPKPPKPPVPPERKCIVDDCERARKRQGRFCNFHVFRKNRPEGFTAPPDVRSERDADRWFLRRYGITNRQRDQMIADQGGLCAACSDRPAEVVDHCHDTLIVRGVLCRRCNLAMIALDHPGLMDQLTRYKRRSHLRAVA